MKFSGYNLINQRLDSEWLIKLLRFCSNDYSGAIGEDESSDPLVVTDNTFSLSPCTFTVGGQLVDMTSSNENELTLSGEIKTNYNFFGIVLPLDKAKQSTGVITNEIPEIIAGYISGFHITQNSYSDNNTPANLEDDITYYNILQEGTNEGWTRYHYDTKKFTSVMVTPTQGVTPDTIENAYIIPVVGYDETNEKVVRLLGYKTGSALEEFLTRSAVDKLIDMLNDRYVWREGGTNVRERGDISNLNVTNNAITSKPNFENYGGTNQDGFISDNSITLDSRYLLLKRQKGLHDNTYSEFYPSGVLAIPAPGFGVFSYPQLELRFGGTNADNFWDARKNLKIITSADRGVTNNGNAPTQYIAPEGTIYLSIVE